MHTRTAGLSFNSVLVLGMALVLAAVVVFPGYARSETGPCILALGAGQGTISVVGSAKIIGSECMVAANTASSPAVSTTGSAKIMADKVCTPGGGSSTGSSQITPAADTTCGPLADPFASTPVPATAACDYTNAKINKSGTLNPGVYCGGITISASSKVTLNPGVYVLIDGPLKVGGSSKLTGEGVAFYLTGTGGSLVFEGSSKTDLEAPASGALAGFVFFAESEGLSEIKGSAEMTLKGATYLPQQTLSLSGSAKNQATSLATFVVNRLSLSGSAKLMASGEALPTTPGPDTTAPVIEPHEDVFAATTSPGGMPVEYVAPIATDNVDGQVPVSCFPESGSVFPIGTTTVECTTQDAANNEAVSTFDVGVVLLEEPDTTAPVIEPHANVHATTTGTSATVTYTPPEALDDVDGAVPVSCEPASGSSFALGTTTITCTAEDSSNNTATSQFLVIVVQEAVPPAPPSPYTMASQPVESYLCGATTRTWRGCDDDLTFSFTDTVGGGVKTIDLGIGSTMGTGTLTSVTIARDLVGTTEESLGGFHPWGITIQCYNDAAYTSPCGDWSAITDDSNDTSDGTYWTANFSAFNRTFIQTRYYRMVINDTGWDVGGVFGSQALQEPYWVITGLR